MLKAHGARKLPKFSSLSGVHHFLFARKNFWSSPMRKGDEVNFQYLTTQILRNSKVIELTFNIRFPLYQLSDPLPLLLPLSLILEGIEPCKLCHNFKKKKVIVSEMQTYFGLPLLRHYLESAPSGG